MRLVVSVLNGAPALRFVDGAAHGGRDRIGVENDQTVRVSRGAADGLHERGLRAEEALLVRVENGDHRHLRQIKTLAQEVDADEHVKFTEAQVADELHALDGLHIRVHVAHLDAHALQILRQILRHLLRQRRDEHTLVALDSRVDLAEQIVDLSLDGPDLHAGVEQSRRADDLLHNLPRACFFIVPGRGGNVDALMDALFEFLEFKRAVVERAGETEAVLHQALLSRAVAVVHRVHLWERNMAFVHKEQEVLGEIVNERQRCGADGSARNYPGIVFDARAVAQLAHHLDVVARALVDTLRLHRLAVVGKLFFALRQLDLDLADGALHLVLRRDIVRRGIDGDMLQRARDHARDGIELRNAVDLVPEKLDAHRLVAVVGGVKLHRVAADAEAIALEGNVVALVADLNEPAQQEIALHRHAGAQGDHQLFKILRLAQTVNARHRGHHDHVPPLEQGAGR